MMMMMMMSCAMQQSCGYQTRVCHAPPTQPVAFNRHHTTGFMLSCCCLIHAILLQVEKQQALAAQHQLLPASISSPLQA
jgi:hypothetical protein